MYVRLNCRNGRRYDFPMKVRIVTMGGNTMYGSLFGEESKALTPREALHWIMNNENKFIKYLQPNGQEVLLNKSAIMNIAEDNYD